ncbi:transposase [Edwardsiella piscicida]|uniref:Transposase DDE domain-containing protein n=1 Tax=Edwardsiella tarda (strain FL6-60) TaxID=718251 RepID=A0A0H3DWE5_EDWTF|nr:hypothetical protein ETAF_2767 [Edwardsiella tarda FL6-60]ARD18745.1 hypothetical protein BXA22_10540 [Edwardsiella piscicida]ELM3737708.1 transposase [Edwardsiella piscicida]QBB12788.1 hypothetical protein EVK84_09705 [Edwardsiella piscicida]QHR95268.1 hypothetical protein GT752_08310 [Edwardsiella piscicida]
MVSPSSQWRSLRYSDLATATTLMIKHVFKLILRVVQGFIDSQFT